MNKILLLIKKHVVLILVVMFASLAVGGAVMVLYKHEYTASELVDYSANMNSTVNANHNAMVAYMDTVVDLCDSGVVVDRANYYYNLYINGNIKDMNEFIKLVQDSERSDTAISGGITKYKDALTAGSIKNIPTHISASAVKASASSGEAYTLVVSLTDKDPAASRLKLRILILAYDLEICKYFPGVTTSIKELIDSEKDISVKKDVSNRQIMLISALVGVLLSVAALAIVYFADNTVSDKETLESIVGKKILARIEDREGVKYEK